MARMPSWVGRDPPLGAVTGERIILAVDFGTTFSGLAWAITSDPNTQTLIDKWPGQSGRQSLSDKVPSEIEEIGNNRNWGFMIDDDVPRLKWFKLELDPQALDEADRGMMEDCKGWIAVRDSRHPPPVVVERFLRKLFKHSEKALRAALTEHVLLTVPVEYVVTHPTTWDGDTVETFELCAEGAGMGDHINLHVLDEPAAAAWYVLQSNLYDLGHGDGLVICDAGGGTVDLVSYQVRFSEPFFSEPPLKLDLLSPEGRIGLCGSSFVDRMFEYNLNERMKYAPGWNEDYSRRVTNFFSKRIKPSFRRVHGQIWDVRVPGLPESPAFNVSNEFLSIDDTIVEQAFRPCIKRIQELVLEEVRSQNGLVRTVLLVGGFGQNVHLYDKLEMVLTHPPDGVTPVRILQPPNGWTAVVRGALIHGLENISPGTSTVMVGTRRRRKFSDASRD